MQFIFRNCPVTYLSL